MCSIQTAASPPIIPSSIGSFAYAKIINNIKVFYPKSVAPNGPMDYLFRRAEDQQKQKTMKILNELPRSKLRDIEKQQGSYTPMQASRNSLTNQDDQELFGVFPQNPGRPSIWTEFMKKMKYRDRPIISEKKEWPKGLGDDYHDIEYTF